MAVDCGNCAGCLVDWRALAFGVPQAVLLPSSRGT